jgi:uncharacterized protein YndB with AHSA1/START domain
MSRVTHDTFTIERTFDASPDRVYEALANPEIKAKWFAGPPSWKLIERTHDFRVGGREHVAGRFENGMTSVFDAQYFDIVPNERVLYSYEMTVNGRKISTSLATFELVPDGKKTKVILTEQGAYFDDPEMAKYALPGQTQHQSRLAGTQSLMDRMAALFSR